MLYHCVRFPASCWLKRGVSQSLIEKSCRHSDDTVIEDQKKRELRASMDHTWVVGEVMVVIVAMVMIVMVVMVMVVMMMVVMVMLMVAMVIVVMVVMVMVVTQSSCWTPRSVAVAVLGVTEDS